MKNTSKKLLSLLILLVMVSTALMGCGSSNDGKDSESKNSDTKEEKTTLTFWRVKTDEQTEKYWVDFIERYEAENPNIDIELTSVPWGDAETKLNVAYAGGTAPDILNYAIVSVPQRAGNGQYLSLDKYIENWEGKDDIYQNILDLGTYDGSVYGVGIKPDPRVFVWRKDLFEAWDFIAATMDKDEMITRYKELDIPITRASAEEEYIAVNPELNSAILEAINVGKGAYMVPYSNHLNEVISAAIERAYYGEDTPEVALKNAADALREEIPTLSN